MLQEVVTRHSRTACGMKECMDQSLSIDDYCKKYYLKITLKKTQNPISFTHDQLDKDAKSGYYLCLGSWCTLVRKTF